MTADLAAPYLDALQAAGGLRVFDGPVPAKTAPPYLVVYCTTDVPEETTLEDVADRIESTAIVHLVGSSGAACRILSGRAWEALVGVRPAVPNRDCSRIRRIDSRPPSTDESTGLVVMDQVDVFQFVSLPG